VSIVAILHARGGIARTSELRAAGVSERALATALRAGEVLRPRQGLYALLSTPSPVLHAAAHGGVAGCATAARLHGLWVLDDTVWHVWMGRAGAARPADCDSCRIHWYDNGTRPDAMATVRRALLQMAHCCGEEAFFAALESALHQRLLSVHDREWIRSRLPTRMRWLVDFARVDADSGLESLVRLRLHRRGIDVRVQVRIHTTGRVDILIGERLVIELDGQEGHADAVSRHKDLLRDAHAALWDYETLRFDYAMIVHDWELVEDAILAKIAAGAHLRRPR